MSLYTKGYNSVENCTSLENFLAHARSLGEIIPHPNGELYDVVIANDGTNARNGSFSKNFGFQSFPLHTDTAFWAIPSRLLVMWSPNASSTSTTLLSWSKILEFLSEKEIKILNDSIFTMQTYEIAKYTAIKFIHSGVRGFRYDPNIMYPANKQSEEFVGIYREILRKVNMIDFNWSGSNALVIDNWSMLHGRNHIKDKNESRQIFRAYVR